MLLAVAGAARGRSHTSKSGSDSNEQYGYYDSRFFDGYDNSSIGAFGSIFEECDDGDEGDLDHWAVHYIPLVVFPLLLLQGIVGNLLAIPTLVNVSRTAWSTVLYLGCLGVTDLIMLLVQCGDAWYQELVKSSLSKTIIDSSDAACKTYYFAYMCVKHLNPWLFVAISIEMMIATRWPKKTYFMCSTERARNVLMLIGIIVVCVDINHFWTFGVPKPGLSCIYMEDFSENFADWVWPVIDIAVELILPLATVSVCFFLTGATIIQRPASQKTALEAEMTKYFLELATLKDFRNVCFILCLFFMCLHLCRIMYALTTIMFTMGYIEVDCLTLRIFKTTNLTVVFLFYSTKIYVYSAFSSMFRAKLREGFLSDCKKLQNCFRAMCTCGHKWAPVPTRDKGEDITMTQGQGKSLDCHDDVTFNSSADPPRTTKTKNTHTAAQRTQITPKIAHGKKSSADQAEDIQ